MRPAPDPRDTPSLLPWLTMANSAFDAWIGFWTGGVAGQHAPLLEMQRQVLRAWTAPWLALGMPGLTVPGEAERGAARRPAPQRAMPPAPPPAPRPAPAPAMHLPAPPAGAPWEDAPAPPVAVMGAPEPAPGEAAPAPEEALPAATPRPRKPGKGASPLRATPPRKSAGRKPEGRKQDGRTPAASARRAPKGVRKPTR